jgi:putative mRNA 3-end processing factor
VNDTDLIVLTEAGLYCPQGDFYVDPWAPVEKCIITHAHGDHARPGSKGYITAQPGARILRSRLGEDAQIQNVQYGEKWQQKDVSVSLHPAGHVLGSSQVRIEYKGNVWVISGDYKLASDPTCEAFEPQPCHTFVSESTFGLPIYRWRSPEETLAEINSWWQANKEAGKCSIIFGYALGKAQRILAGLDPTIGPIYTHGAVENLVEAYRATGVSLPPTKHAGSLPKGTKFSGSIIVAPPSAQNTPWMRQFGNLSTAFASGWMRIRGTRRRKSVDRGFALSDHADWDGLNQAIRATKAERILVTHGYTAEMVRWLKENGMDAAVLQTKFEGESGEMQPAQTEVEADEVPQRESEAEP